ncbi:hypothetical protein OPQ81_011862 [Rhizoctonia solani]|nr:hypothetical protein OPQ81_011862 [Rhizoctonia solani]
MITHSGTAGHRQLNVPEDEYESETYEHALVHGLKRAHTNTSEQGPLKKRVKGKQGGLQGIMKMPIEVFMEIAPYVNPGDLITLIRTNKFFRAMLLNRSAAPFGNAPSTMSLLCLHARLFIRNDDKEGLAEWMQQRQAAWETQLKEGDELLEYIYSVAASRSGELKDLKAERKEKAAPGPGMGRTIFQFFRDRQQR